MDKIKVGVRIRPLIQNEMDQRLAIQWGYKEKSIYQIDPRTGKKIGNTFIFDYIFNEKHSNENLFSDLAKPILDSVIQGYNGTIFAYGQTSSGKTHTMNGNAYDEGIIPRSIKYLFHQLNSKNDRIYLVRASYLEIYNEIIIDLLTKRKCSKIRENLGNVVVVDLQEEVVDSPEKVLELLALGNKNRQTAETAMNEQSSRSHAIFRIIIESRGGNDDFIESHLNLVDLAGSEKTDLNTGIRSKEGCAINKSLFMLSKVISQLSEQQEVKQFISYRDSKLTRILQNSLGGNSLTAIICAITPSTVDETISTLGFALRAKKIHVNPFINEIISDQTLLKKFQQEIESLQLKLNEKDQLIERLKEKDQLIERLNSLKTKVLGASSSTFLIKEDLKDLATNRRMTWHRIDSTPSPMTSLLHNSHQLSLNSPLEMEELPVLTEIKYMPTLEPLNIDLKTKNNNEKSILKSNFTNIKSNTKLPRRNKENPKSQDVDKISQIERENNDLKMELELLRRKFRIREEELVSRLENYENVQSKSKNKNSFTKSGNELLTQKSVSSYNDRISMLELEKMENEKTIENLKNHLDNLEKKSEQLENGHRDEEEMREKFIQELQTEYAFKCQEYKKKIEMLENKDEMDILNNMKLKEKENKEKVEAYAMNINQLKETIKTLDKENEKFKKNNQKDDYSVKFQEYEKKIEILNDLKLKNEDQFEVYEKNIIQLNETIKGMEIEMEKLKNKQADYSSKCQEYEKKIEMLENIDEKEMLDNLKLKEKDNNEKIETYEMEINQLKETIKTLDMENEKLKNYQKDDYSDKFQEYEKKIELLENLKLKIEENKDKIETYEKNTMQLMETIRSVEMENEKLKNNKCQQNEIVNNMKSKEKENNEKLEICEKNTIQLKERIKVLEMENKKLKSSKGNEIVKKDLNKKIDEKMKLIKDLQDKLELENKEKKLLNNELTKLNSKIKCINDEKTELELHLQSGIAEKCILQTTIDDYKGKLDKVDEENRKMINDYNMKLDLLKIEKDNFMKQLNINIKEMNNIDDSHLLNEIQDLKLQIELLENEKTQLNNNYEWAVESKQEKQKLLDEKIDEIEQLNLEMKNYRKEFNEFNEKYEILLRRQQNDPLSIDGLNKNEDSNCPADHRCNYKFQLDSINSQLREEINSLGVEVASKNLYHSDSLKLLQTLLKCVVEKNQEFFNCINEKFGKEKNELRENIKKYKFELTKEIKLREQVESLVENYDSGLNSWKEEREELISKMKENEEQYKMLIEKKQEEMTEKLTKAQTECQEANKTLEKIQQQYTTLESNYRNQEEIIQEFKKNQKQHIYHFKATQTSFIENASPFLVARCASNFTDAATSTDELNETCKQPLEQEKSQTELLENSTHHSISSNKSIRSNLSSEHEELLIEKKNLQTNYDLLKDDYRKLVCQLNQLQNREEINQMESHLKYYEMQELDPAQQLEQTKILAHLSLVENCRILELYSQEIDTLKEELESTKNHLNKVLSELESQPKGAIQQVESLKLKLLHKETDYAVLREIYKKLIRYFNRYKRENPPLQEIQNDDLNCEEELNRDLGEEEEELGEDVKEMKEIDRLNRIITALNVNTVCQWTQHVYMMEELYIEKENLEKQLAQKEKELEKCRDSYLETKKELFKNETHQGRLGNMHKNESTKISSLKLELASIEDKLKTEKEINEMLVKELEKNKHDDKCDNCDKCKDQIFHMTLERRELERKCNKIEEESCTLRQQLDILESNRKHLENRTTHNDCEKKISDLENRNKLLVNVCKIRQNKICELQDIISSNE